MQHIKIEILAYPGAAKSALFGMQEILSYAGTLAKADNTTCFECRIIEAPNWHITDQLSCDILILPPSIGQRDYMKPHQSLCKSLQNLHAKGATIASACAGAFLIAQAGICDTRPITTHWGLEQPFRNRFPGIPLDTDQILINHGDIITAGGLMAWVDLSLEIITQHLSPDIMRRVGRYFVVDTGLRDQKPYRDITQAQAHGDHAIILAQNYLAKHYRSAVRISDMARHVAMTERTLLRRFLAATGKTPSAYLQILRIQDAREQLATTRNTIDQISFNVGYENPNAFRKTFRKITGLTPSAYRGREHR